MLSELLGGRGRKRETQPPFTPHSLSLPCSMLHARAATTPRLVRGDGENAAIYWLQAEYISGGVVQWQAGEGRGWGGERKRTINRERKKEGKK